MMLCISRGTSCVSRCAAGSARETDLIEACRCPLRLCCVADIDTTHVRLLCVLHSPMNNMLLLCHCLMSVLRFAYSFWITAADVAVKFGRHSESFDGPDGAGAPRGNAAGTAARAGGARRPDHCLQAVCCGRLGGGCAGALPLSFV